MVSVRITRTTIVIEMMPATGKVGIPNANGRGKAKIGPVMTLEKSAMPTIAAPTVPTTIAMRIDSREIAGTLARLRTSTTSSVNPASAMLLTEP